MAHPTETFRARYRAQVATHYNPWLHAGFVFGYGIVCISLAWSSTHQITALQWLTVPATLVFFNLCIYLVHRHLGHHKHALARLFYARHTGDHHSFFTPGHMTYDSPRDWRVILFPAWLIVLHSLAITLPAWWLIKQLSPNVAGLFAGCMILGYLLYELFHSCEHLPADHPVARLPWIRQMHQLHAMHHRRELMQGRNFNIVLPLMDYLFGTLYWEPGPHDNQESS
ncbi:Fatty acid hydroxylase superfamily protein [Pseudomonas sp. NFR09]|uniref:sterol desaturase family protein n=1 Tax=Pseudomonas sp. NFR09 TaxID=1566249 RepID=UPI0008D096BD|nr:sterol desaturase family protein [Pseudomonas sp. NFR09]SET82813.1 Fatty acid hydroxylase superfamily protein [Pseudomonas sp. NFR09]